MRGEKKYYIWFHSLIMFPATPFYGRLPRDNNEFDNVLIALLATTWAICIGFEIKRESDDNSRGTLKTHQEYVSDLKIGMPAVAIFLTIEYASLLVTYWSFEIACPYYFVSHVLMIVFFSAYVTDACSYRTLFPFHRIYLCALTGCTIIGGCRAWAMHDMKEGFHALYVFLIVSCAMDTWIVYNKSERIRFERKFNETNYLITHEGIKEKHYLPEELKENTIDKTKGLQRIYTIELQPRDLQRGSDDKLKSIP